MKTTATHCSLTDADAVRRRPVPPRTHCPPSRRGHAWRELSAQELAQIGVVDDPYALRVCGRCGRRGCVTKQGVTKEIA